MLETGPALKVTIHLNRDTGAAAIRNRHIGRWVQQSVLMTRAAAILGFIGGVRGSLHVTFEEETHSAWLYDLLSRRVDKLVACNPRKNALLKSGNKGGAIDARKLAELLRAGLLSPVYHGEPSALEVQQLARSACRNARLPFVYPLREASGLVRALQGSPGQSLPVAL